MKRQIYFCKSLIKTISDKDTLYSGGNLSMHNLSLFIGIIAALELILAIILGIRFARTKQPLTLLVLLIDIGLFIDAFFIAIGQPLGGLPEAVSRLRFLAHGGLIPLLFPICGYGLKAGKRAMTVLWIFTAVVILIGIAHAFALDLNLIQMEDEGIIRHTMADTSPLWARIVSAALSFGTVIPLIICGIIIWIKQKNPNLFLSGFLMFGFAAIGPATGNYGLVFFITMFGELFMILFALLYIIKDEKSAA